MSLSKLFTVWNHVYIVALLLYSFLHNHSENFVILVCKLSYLPFISHSFLKHEQNESAWNGCKSIVMDIFAFMCLLISYHSRRICFYKLFVMYTRMLKQERIFMTSHFPRMLPLQSLIVLPCFQIIAAQEEMLRKERELEEARKKLAHIRQQQYKFLPSELREDQGWTHLVWLDVISVGSWLLRMIGCSLYAELEMSHVIDCVTVRWLVQVKCDWLTWD